MQSSLIPNSYKFSDQDNKASRPKKRKVFTEPNSPKYTLGETSNFGSMMQQTGRGQIVGGNQMVIGREMPIRSSNQKFSIKA